MTGSPTYLYAGAIRLNSTITSDGIGAIFLDDVGCEGTETRLKNCTANGRRDHNCNHTEDAGVTCVAGKFMFLVFYSPHCIAMCIHGIMKSEDAVKSTMKFLLSVLQQPFNCGCNS